MPILAEEKYCTGCTACMSGCLGDCIKMERDVNGFAYPVIPDLSKCISCGLCESSCPIVMNKPIGNQSNPIAFAAYSNNSDLRKDSSSGGVFSEIAFEIIMSGGIVYGAVYDEHFRVYHTSVETIDDLHRIRRAKYAESWLGNTFSEVKSELDKGRQVLFSGTPCQVGGLIAFLKKDYDNLLCVDFICHGVPSPMVWEAYVEYRANTDNNGILPIEINLRDKSSGWSRYRYSNYYKYPDGIEYRETSNDSVFMKLFTQDYILRKSCENCKFKGYSRPSDITLGDFWGIWDIAPEMDDDKGTSVVIIQSKTGMDLWDSIKERIRFKNVQLEQISQQNPSMLVSSEMKAERDNILKRIISGRFDFENGFKPFSVSLWRKIASIFKNRI